MESEPAESGKNAPDPQLFPYLARRLADTRTPPGADEYLAAATVLAMKYGPAVLDQVSYRMNGVFKRLRWLQKKNLQQKYDEIKVKHYLKS